jgi:uncharacterized RDD family membrane protein YckC
MIRQGAAMSRGAELICRDCTGAAKSSGPRPAARSAVRSSVALEYASFGRRLGAHVIDSVIMNVVVGGGSFLVGLGAGMMGMVEPTALTILGGVLGGLVPMIYFVWFWVRKGATPGKSALGIQIVGADGSALTGMQSFIRFLGYIPSSLFFCVGYLWMIWDGEKRCWHDMMAGTRVIRV